MQKVLSKKQSEYLEEKYKVFISHNQKHNQSYYNRTSPTSTYGWCIVPKEWIDEVKSIKGGNQSND